MAKARLLAAVLRTAAAASLAAAVASCGSDRVADISATASPTIQGETVTNGSFGDLTASRAAPEAQSAIETPTPSAVPATTTSVLRIAPLSVSAISNTVVGDTRIQAPNPVTIRIPAIHVEAPIIPLGLRGDGTIEVPEGPEETGWWLGGPEPGEPGPAVILGHVDSREGPAVFFHLRYLTAGEEIHIDREDGSTVTYVVDGSERHPKEDFPTEAVYGSTEQPTLRLVTCGGDYDFDVRSYNDNVIVFASMV